MAFFAILTNVKIQKTVKNVPKSFKHSKKNMTFIKLRVSKIYIEFVNSQDKKLNNKLLFFNMHLFKPVSF